MSIDAGLSETDRSWVGIARMGGVAALLAGIAVRRNFSAEYALLHEFGLFPAGPGAAPESVAAWFDLLQTHPLIGWTLLNGWDLINYALLGLMFLGLYAALRRVRPAPASLALILSLLGVGLAFAANQSFAMLGLSGRYAAADAAGQAGLIGAGEALLAIHRAGADYGVGLYPAFGLLSIAGLVASLLMLRTDVFNRATAIVGLIASLIALSYYFTHFINPALDIIPIPGSAPFLMAWYIMVGLRLVKFRATTERSAA